MPFEVEFADSDLDRLETDPGFTGGYGKDIVRGFRKAMQQLRAAEGEKDLYALRGLRFEKLKGARSHQHSVRINKQWRLILELKGEGANRQMRVVGIEDYH